MSRRRHLSARAGDYLRGFARFVGRAVPPAPAELVPAVSVPDAIGEPVPVPVPVPAAAQPERPAC